MSVFLLVQDQQKQIWIHASKFLSTRSSFVGNSKTTLWSIIKILLDNLTFFYAYSIHTDNYTWLIIWVLDPLLHHLGSVDMRYGQNYDFYFWISFLLHFVHLGITILIASPRPGWWATRLYMVGVMTIFLGNYWSMFC